ncbi:MAG: potassium transporter [Muribaculaceae bacterium]|nr:potassium transporter [Muribaculaceae bacterium]
MILSTQRLDIIRKAYARFVHRFVATLRVLSACLEGACVLAAIGCLTLLVLYLGYDHRVISWSMIMPYLRIGQGVFIATILFRLILLFPSSWRQSRPLMRVTDGVMLLTLLPWIYPRPAAPWLPWLDTLLYSPWLLMGVLGVYSALVLCLFAIRTVGRRVNPTIILAASFLLFITVGTLLLMMPKCTVGGISFADSLFVSTSAVCITGLTPVDVATEFTPLGLVILAVMMQVGALGVMTFTSVFALFFSGNTSIYSQLMVKDMIYTKTINSLLPTLLLIFLFTLSVEAIGAVAVLWSIHGVIPGMSLRSEMAFAAFHSLSAFCNAGFSTLPDGLSNPALLRGNQLIYLVTSVLVVAGGIGYPILVNARDALFQATRRLHRRLRHRPPGPRKVHLMDMNTRVVLTTTSILLVGGTVGFYLLESSHALAGMSPWQKLVQSVFNSVTPRSAGFASVAPSGFLNVTVLMLLFLMAVGGASQSTAGGIKVNTLATAWLHLRSTLSGRDRVTAHHRNVAPASVSRAQAVILLAIVSYLLFSIVLLLFEPALPARMLLFESCSALFTVGSSLGATPLLGVPAKILLCLAMFVGRMGLLSLLAGLVGSRRLSPISFPSDNIIIS